MTLKNLIDACQKHGVPDDALLVSDSGWECDPTDMNAAYYNRELNMIIFTQDSTDWFAKYDLSKSYFLEGRYKFDLIVVTNDVFYKIINGGEENDRT